MGLIIGFVFLDEEARIVFAGPDTSVVGLDRGEAARALAGVSAADGREVSEPFMSVLNGQPMTGLSVPSMPRRGPESGLWSGCWT